MKTFTKITAVSFPWRKEAAVFHAILLSSLRIFLLELAPLHCCRLLGVIGPVPRPLWIRVHIKFSQKIIRLIFLNKKAPHAKRGYARHASSLSSCRFPPCLELAPLHYCRLLGVIGPISLDLSG
jgi:hypothetical protein